MYRIGVLGTVKIIRLKKTIINCIFRYYPNILRYLLIRLSLPWEYRFNSPHVLHQTEHNNYKA